MEMLRRSSVFAAEVFDRSPTDKELVSQAKALCRDYINSRLNRVGMGWTSPEHGLASSSGTMREISSVLLWLGTLLCLFVFFLIFYDKAKLRDKNIKIRK